MHAATECATSGRAVSVDTHHMLARVVASRFKCCWSDAEDAASEAILYGISHRNLDIPLLVTVAKTAHLQALRRKQFEHRVPVVLETAAGQEIAAEAAQVIDAIYNLSPRQRDAVSAFALGDTREEIAEDMGVEVKTVDYHLYEARKSLMCAGFRDEEARRPYVGVTKHHRKYRAQIDVNGKTIHIGLFACASAAASAYDAMAMKVLGPNASLNFPEIGVLQ